METETKTESLATEEFSRSDLPDHPDLPPETSEDASLSDVAEEKVEEDDKTKVGDNGGSGMEVAPSDLSEPELISISDVEAVDFCKTAYGAIQYELAKVIVGQNRMIEEIVICVFTSGHALLLGVPGLAKTLVISTLARVLDLSFKRIQFTPDMIPEDIIGTEVLNESPDSRKKQPKFLEGPVFANIILADEINRTPPKIQSAMLEAMLDQKITSGGNTRNLPQPFFVFATQNPLEQEGTYPLLESQLDRFMFMIHVDYPTEEEEFLLMKLGTGIPLEGPRTILHRDHIHAIQQTVRLLPVPDHVYKYAERIVRSTRPKTKDAFEVCKKWLSFGAGPRASLALIMAAKAHALIRGQVHVHCGNVAAVAPSVLRHRLAVNFLARSEGISADDVVLKILEQIPRTDPLT